MCANFSGTKFCQCYFVSFFNLWGHVGVGGQFRDRRRRLGQAGVGEEGRVQAGTGGNAMAMEGQEEKAGVREEGRGQTGAGGVGCVRRRRKEQAGT